MQTDYQYNTFKIVQLKFCSYSQLNKHTLGSFNNFDKKVNSINDIRQIAENKLKASQILCDAGLYDDSFYLCGYSIELLLKANICKKLDMDDLFNFEKINTRRLFPEKKNNSNFKQLFKQFKVHDLEQLLILAGLFNHLAYTLQEDYQLKIDWSMAFEWTEESRYKLKFNRIDAINIYNSTKNIMLWLQKNL